METIKACREIIATSSYQKIDGMMVDLVSANVTVQVFDALNEKNQAIMAALSTEKMIKLAFKLVG